MRHLSKIRDGFSKKPLKYISFLIIFLVVYFVIFISYTIFSYYPVLSSVDSIVKNKNSGFEFYDKDGQLFYSTDQRRVELVNTDLLPEKLIKATIVVEDKNFYTHKGIDVSGILRALRDNIFKFDLKFSGGSTITQQLSKNALLGQNKSIFRKLKEAILATMIEAKYSKKEILAMYLSSVYYGDGSHGISQASKNYFGKEVHDLDVSEIATLVGLIRAPSYYSPRESLQRATERRNFVLKLMKDQGYIDQQEYDKSLSEELTLVKKEENFYAIHFAIWLKSELETFERYKGQQNLKIYTSLDSSLQKSAEEKVKEHVSKLKTLGGTNAAMLVLENGTGKILAFVGSVDWEDESNDGKYNSVFALRQPGSAFKPVVYLSALENGFTLSTSLNDEPTTFENNYTPGNFDNKFRGQVLPRFALGNSINVPTVQLANMTGFEKILSTASSLGITTLDKKPEYYGSNLALGGGEVSLFELTNSYATLANGGQFQPVSAITKVITSEGRTETFSKGASKQAVSVESSYLITSILSDNTARFEVFGDRSLLNLPFPVAVKTGTTDGFKDSWTIGYTPDVTVGVWVGDNRGKSMENITGVIGAAAIWNDYFSSISSSLSKKQFIKPSGVTTAKICKKSGNKAAVGSKDFLDEFFVSGTEPKNEELC